MHSNLRKGQLSLEFLLIFAIFLSVLGVFLFSFSKVRSQTEYALEEILVSKLANDLSYSINSVCILGDGNVREIEHSAVPGMVISCNETTISLHLANISEFNELNCKTVCTQASGKNIKIENRNGTVFVS